MSNQVRVLLITDDQVIQEKVEFWLTTVGMFEYLGSFPSFRALQSSQLYLPDLILVAFEDIDPALQTISQLSLTYPRGRFVIVTANPSVQAVREMMRADVLDYIDLDQDVAQAGVDLLQSYLTDRERYERLSMQILSERVVTQARSLVFLGNKGGVGKSTIATNLAAVFAQRGTKTVLVDLDLRSGVDHLFLGLSPERTLGELAKEVTDFDSTVMDRYLSHHSSGLDVLCAPRSPEDANEVTPGLIRTVLQTLLRQYDYVIVDTSPLVDDILLAAVDVSHDFFLISTMNVNVLHNARRLMDLWNKLGYSESNLRHILNRANTKHGLRVSDVHRILKFSVFWQLRNDERAVDRAINDGELLVLKHPNNRISREINGLADRLFDQYRYRPTRRSRGKTRRFRSFKQKTTVQG